MCVDVAQLTYEGLVQDWKNGSLTDDSVRLALHEALRHLRDRELGKILGTTWNARDIVLCDESNIATWAPYVHSGL